MTRKSDSGGRAGLPGTCGSETAHFLDSQGSLLPGPWRPAVPVGEPRCEAGGGCRLGLAQVDRSDLSLLPPGTEAGPPGPRGPPAAPRVASASRCGSGHAATPPRGTGAACAWGRTARRGGYLRSAPRVATARLLSSRCGRLPCGFSSWIQLSLSVASFSVEPNGPPLLFHPLISTKAWGGQHHRWGRRGPCRVRSAQRS